MNSETKIAGIVKNGLFISSSTKKGALLKLYICKKQFLQKVAK